jgi:Tol biopolymer transport system component
VGGSAEARGVYLGQLDSLDTRRLFDADGHAEYAATGYVLFPREGKLMAQRFDPDRVELMGEPFPIAEYGRNIIALSASAAGPIVYRTLSPDNGQRQLVWMDRSGRETDKVLYSDTSSQGPSMSRDGRHIAVFRYAGGNMDVWSYDIARHAWDRITFDSADDIFPLWSPDGRRMVFSSNRTDGLMRLYSRTLASPPGSEELLLKTTEGMTFPMDWSADGRFVLYNRRDAKRGWDIWALPMQGDRTPIAAVRTDFNERSPAFSPDGAWIAYESDRSGRSEIYVQAFPGPGGEAVVSTNGGGQARWNPNGRELFYIASDDRLMAVPMRFAPGGKTVEIGAPVGLFPTNVGSTALNTKRQQYMVGPDGQTFVMNSVPEKATASPISVILNWKPAP